MSENLGAKVDNLEAPLARKMGDQMRKITPLWDNEEKVPTWGMLSLTQAHNEGRITFMEWLALSRDWSLRMIEQTKGKAAAENWAAKLPPLPTPTEEIEEGAA
jgi:hypothetical protein